MAKPQCERLLQGLRGSDIKGPVWDWHSNFMRRKERL
jgi:hypothetical protein